mmetsp:Transcript_34569/g.54072  ORF Transcript_34569/g.54072 Transcript_34569/m.54072 type:complete len:475 (+) Transcript_34569:39-1463(+)
MGATKTRDHSVLAIFDPATTSFKLAVLLGACFLTFGSYYCYDIVGALSTTLLNPFYGINNTQESFLYAVYSLPNTVLPFFGGLLVDKVLGVKFGGILFGGLVFLGQVIWATSAFFPTSGGFYLAIFGRFVFGLGGESLSVTQSTYCGKWFDKDQLGTAFGITLAFARIGSAINFLITPFLGNVGVGLALWFGVLTCTISMIFALQLAFWDRKGEKVHPPSTAESDVIHFKDILKFRYTLWFLIIVCVFFYISVFVWLQNAVAFFVKVYGISNGRAGIVVSIPYFVAAFAAPTFGFIIDKTGLILLWLAFACLLNCVNMLVMLFLTFIPPAIPMFFVGISYSMVAASLWPCIPLIVKGHELGTAYGLFFAIQNVGLFLAPLLVGHITNTGYYTTMMLTFAECSFLAFALTISVAVCDFFEGRRINKTAKELRAQKLLDEAEKEIEESSNISLIKKTGSVNPDDSYDRFALQDDFE